MLAARPPIACDDEGPAVDDPGYNFSQLPVAEAIVLSWMNNTGYDDGDTRSKNQLARVSINKAIEGVVLLCSSYPTTN